MIRIYDSLRRAVVPLEPIVPGRVGIYACGQTVQAPPHLGHARKEIAFDIVVRWLEARGLAVTYVRNITDIDDKIIAAAVAAGEPLADFTARMIARTAEDFALLGLRAPDAEPRATGHIARIAEMIGALEASGHAYAADDVYYSVRSFAGYGKLSGRKLDEMESGARIAIDEAKRDPLDFVLWKAAKADEPADARWASPWGEGRPGWHIECSAMAKAILGDTIDIHGGGADLKFPHHENEIAQSEAANRTPFANLWMHAGRLDMDGEKMSKSLGNIVALRNAVAAQGADAIRFAFVRSHYRSRIDYSAASIEDAKAALGRLRAALRGVAPDAAPLDWDEPHAARFAAAMDEDFNTPQAVAVLFELAGAVNREQSPALARQLAALARILGIELVESALDDAAIETQIAANTAARVARDYAESDRIRAELDAKGIVLEYRAGGTTWRRKG